MKKYIVVGLIFLIVPQLALAAWWNPLSWFNSWLFSKPAPVQEVKTQALENRVKELEQKIINRQDTLTPEVVTAPTITPVKHIDTSEEIKAKISLQNAQAEIKKLNKQNQELTQIKINTDTKAQTAKDEYIDGLTILVSKYAEDIEGLKNWLPSFDPLLKCLVEKGKNNEKEIKYFTTKKGEIETFLNQTNWFAETLKSKKLEYKQKPLSFYYNFDYAIELGKDQISYKQNPLGYTEWLGSYEKGVDDNLKTRVCDDRISPAFGQAVVPEIMVNTKLENLNAISTQDHILGNSEALIKIIEFADLECPFCKNFHKTMLQLIEHYGPNGQVAWVYRHFPLDQLHSKARKEAEASECAFNLGGNDKFWAYITKVFETTSSNNGLDPAQLSIIAKDIGLDQTAFTQCQTSGATVVVVEAHYQDAVASGGNGTPFLIVITADGKKIALQGAIPFEGMKQLIDSLLDKK